MKKSLFLIIALCLALCLCLASCGGNNTNAPDGDNSQGENNVVTPDINETPVHTHKFGEWMNIKNATCTENGEMARYCDCGEKQSEPIYATGHSEVVDAAIAPTCTESGLSAGKHCSVCNEVLVGQAVVDALGHSEVIDTAVAPTCTEAGLSEGKHCAVCNLVLVGQTVVDALGHTEVIDKAVAATCTQTGLTEGKHCSVCNEVLVSQGTSPIIPHTYDDKYDETCNICGFVRDAECAHRELDSIPGYAPTCTTPGLTNGQKCKKCGEIITAQIIINALGHTEVIDAAVAPTCTETGLTEGKHCSVCNVILTAQSTIPAKGHTEVIDSAIAPTCTATGLTEGKHCSVCQMVLVSQTVVPTLPHTYGEWVTTKTANCGQDGEMARYCSCGHKQTEVIYGAGMHTEIIDFAVEPTCTTTGLTEGTHCSYCNTILVQQTVVPMLDHEYQSEYSFDNSFHWYVCKGCGLAKDKAEHQLADDGICTICQQPIGPTEGIIYDKSDDGTYAMVVAYSGTAAKVKIADTYEGLPVTVIYDDAFRSNKTITSVIIPDSVTSIGNYAFENCSSLTSVVIPDSVTSIGNNGFFRCSSLSSIVIPDSVTSIGNYAFSYCFSLTSIVIPDSVTSIGYMAFYGCNSLTSVVIPDNVTFIGSYAFSYCSSLTSIVIGDSVASIGDGPYFAYCSSLINIEVSKNNQHYKSIDGNLYSKDETILIQYAVGKSETPFVIPYNVTSIDDWAFYGCTSLIAILIPDSVTSIGYHAFYDCSSLISIVIPDSVTYIGDYAFYDCSNLKDVYYTGSEEEWAAISIESGNSYLTGATIHYNCILEN